MTEAVADDQLRSFFERWQRLEEEKRAIADDLKELFAEMKGTGFDTKVARKVFRDRTADANERAEFEAVYDLYWSALSGPRAGRARSAREEGGAQTTDHEPETPAIQGDEGGAQITEPQHNAAQSDQASEPASVTLDGGRADETPVDDAARKPDGNAHAQTTGDKDRDTPVGGSQDGEGASAPAAPRFTPLSKDETPRERCLRNKPSCQHPDACRSSVFNEHCRACRAAMASLETEGSAA